MWSVSDDNDCKKCGQSSRSVVGPGTQIQTSCNFKRSYVIVFFFMGCVRCLFSSAT